MNHWKCAYERSTIMTKAIKWFVLMMGRGEKIKKSICTITNELIITRKEKKNMNADVAAQNSMKRCMHTAQHGSRPPQKQSRNWGNLTMENHTYTQIATASFIYHQHRHPTIVDLLFGLITLCAKAPQILLRYSFFEISFEHPNVRSPV